MSLHCKNEGQDEGEYLSDSCPARALHMVLPHEPLTQGWLDSRVRVRLVSWAKEIVTSTCSPGHGVSLSFPPLTCRLEPFPTQSQRQARGQRGDLHSLLMQPLCKAAHFKAERISPASSSAFCSLTDPSPSITHLSSSLEILLLFLSPNED